MESLTSDPVICNWLAGVLFAYVSDRVTCEAVGVEEFLALIGANPDEGGALTEANPAEVVVGGGLQTQVGIAMPGSIPRALLTARRRCHGRRRGDN